MPLRNREFDGVRMFNGMRLIRICSGMSMAPPGAVSLTVGHVLVCKSARTGMIVDGATRRRGRYHVGNAGFLQEMRA